MPVVTIYTQPTCGYSRQLKEWLKANGIQYIEKDVTSDREAWDELADLHKAHATPLIVLGAKKHLGFNPEELKKMIGE